jgi:hypothetical protein
MPRRGDDILRRTSLSISSRDEEIFSAPDIPHTLSRKLFHHPKIFYLGYCTAFKTGRIRLGASQLNYRKLAGTIRAHSPQSKVAVSLPRINKAAWQ